MSNIEFQQPLFLTGLLILPLLVWGLFKTNGQSNISYSSIELLNDLPTSLKQKSLWLIPFLYLLTLACSLIALAQPTGQTPVVTNETEGIAIALVVDVSTSMEFDMRVGNEKQPRLDVAKQVLKQFVLGDDRIKSRENDLISVITFARYSDTLVPLTKSHNALVSITDEMTTSSRMNEDGTAFGDATALAAAQLNQYEQAYGLEQNSIKSKIIILLTDGENNSGDYEPLMAASMAAQWGIKIYTISLSDKDQIQLTPSGQEMSSNDWLLQQMANASGGLFRRADSLQSLTQIYKTISELETSKLQQVAFQQSTPLFHIPTLIALFSLVLVQILQAVGLRSKA